MKIIICLLLSISFSYGATEIERPDGSVVVIEHGTMEVDREL